MIILGTPRKQRQWYIYALSLFAITALFLFALPGVEAKMSVGTNLNGVNYYSSEVPFANLMKMSSPWITSTVANNEWDSNQEASIPSDTNGYPTAIPFNDSSGRPTYVHTILPAPADGTYTFKCDGAGQVRVSGPGLGWTTYNVNWSTITFNISGSNFGANGVSNIYLEVRQSTNGNNLRNIRVWRPGYGDETRTFYQGFKDRLGIYSTLRFMDWANTNNSPVVNYWNDVPQKTYYTMGGPKGVAIDYMIQLCNETGKNMWLCVPHMASDTFCNDVGYDISHSLNSNLRLYVEYSNEVWNGAFGQSNWVNNNISDPTGANSLPRKYGYRASQVMNTFRNQMTSVGRGGNITRVLSMQAANVWTVQEALITGGSQCDAIACAPYFGHAFTPSDVSTYGIPSVDTLASNDQWTNLNAVSQWMTSWKNQAATSGKQLLCYEGGQTYGGILGAENNQSLTNQLMALNRSWQMKNIYRWGYNGQPGYLGLVNSNNVSLFMNFSDCGTYSKWGYWGSQEWIDQPVGTGGGQAQKAWAIQDWIWNG